MHLTRRDVLKFGLGSGLVIVSSGIAGCGGDGSDDDRTFRFDHGVASGDPLADRVILWTRVSASAPGAVRVAWDVSTDPDFRQLVNQDEAEVGSERDYTIKVDVQGLQPAQTYYFRFRAGDAVSTTGQTRTLPASDAAVDAFRMAVFSCSNYPAGYFHAYADVAARSDVDLVLHLGDYLYEYARTTNGEPAYASASAAALGREVVPDRELVALDDYRMRYAQYRTDPDLQALHARHPFVVVWDDHEITNDAWREGAENHQSDIEGDYGARKRAAIQAYFEWLPLRPIDPDAEGRIYRAFSIGTLAHLIMLDTRIVGRDEQLDYADYTDPQTGVFDAGRFAQDLTRADRSLLGSEQLEWLLAGMTSSSATWQILGQQVLMTRMLLPAVTLTPTPQNPTVSVFEFGEIATAALTYQSLLEGGQSPDQAFAALTPAQQAIMADPVKLAYLDSPRIPYNLDAWDGYAYERELVLGAVRASGQNLLVLAGDTHNAWTGTLTDAAGTALGVEMATPAVSSPGLESYLAIESPEAARAAETGLVQLVADLDRCNVFDRGYLTVTLTPQAAHGEWRFTSSVTSKGFSVQPALTFDRTVPAR